MKTNNALVKKLAVSSFLLVFSATMAGTSTYAWFSMNRTVAASGMKVSATASSALVIGSALPVTTETSVAFTDAAKQLKPATRIATGDNTKTGNITGLEWVATGDIGAGDGKTIGTVTYADAINNDTDNYYTDYIVYIASSGGDIENQDLTVKFDSATITQLTDVSMQGIRNTRKALAIDFYVTENTTSSTSDLAFTDGEPTNATYAKTLWLADAVKESGPNTSETLTLLSNKTIPQNTKSDGVIRVVMRVYFDGAKESAETFYKADKADVTAGISGTFAASGTQYYTYSSGTYSTVATPVVGNFATYYEKSTVEHLCYVHTNKVDTSNIEFGVTFEIKDHTA